MGGPTKHPPRVDRTRASNSASCGSGGRAPFVRTSGSRNARSSASSGRLGTAGRTTNSSRTTIAGDAFKYTPAILIPRWWTLVSFNPSAVSAGRWSRGSDLIEPTGVASHAGSVVASVARFANLDDVVPAACGQGDFADAGRGGDAVGADDGEAAVAASPTGWDPASCSWPRPWRWLHRHGPGRRRPDRPACFPRVCASCLCRSTCSQPRASWA